MMIWPLLWQAIKMKNLNILIKLPQKILTKTLNQKNIHQNILMNSLKIITQNKNLRKYNRKEFNKLTKYKRIIIDRASARKREIIILKQIAFMNKRTTKRFQA